MNRLRKYFTINPIIVKEIRSRMRGPRAFITLTAILIVMGGIMYAVLQIILATSRYSTILSPQIGQTLFASLAFLELFMISAVTPSVTSGAISSEKERQTYEMLMATPLSPSSIIWGKLISALSYVFLLLFAAIPLASVVFIFGGVDPRGMAKVLLVLLVIAVSFGVLGVFMSTLFGRTGRATIASFVIVMVLMLGPLFLAVLYTALTQGKEPPRLVLALSPISALSAALTGIMGQSDSTAIFYILGGIFNLGVSPVSSTSIPRPLYHYSLPFYIFISTILFLLSTRLIQPARRWRMRKKEWLIGSAIIVVLSGLFVAAYLLSASRYEWATNPNAGTQFSNPAMPPVPGPVNAVERAVVVAEPSGMNPTPTADLPEGALSEQETAAVYAAVARQFYFVDHTFGNNPPNWARLYLINTTNDSSGDPDASTGSPVLLSDNIQGIVIKDLSDLPAEVTWVPGQEAVPTNPKDGAVDNGKGAVITFGNIYPQEDGSVHVSASLYFASLGATGKTYILTKVDGVWTVTGTTGVEWIS